MGLRLPAARRCRCDVRHGWEAGPRLSMENRREGFPASRLMALLTRVFGWIRWGDCGL